MEGEMEKLTFLFFGTDNKPYFSRDDAEQAEHDHSQMSLFLLFPYREDKVITHGMRVGYVDALGDFQAFEIRKARNYEADHYQEITAEHIAISELTDEHFAPAEWDNVTAETALRQLLQGTGWQVGNVTASGTSSGSVSMGNVWQDIRTIEQNWNVYITPRIVMAAGGISQRFLDISPAGGTWRGLRLSLEKNLDDAGVTWDDTNLKTALYGYGKGQTVEGSTENTPLTFENVVWTDTRNAAGTTGHPAKPKGQKYLEDDRATRDYGRNGRPRFGFYQNGDIDDPNILIEKTWETLKTVSVPDVTIDGTVRDLYRLGLTDVPIRLHDTALVEIRPTGVTLQKEIIRYLEDLLNPTTSHLTIGAYIPNIIYINREMADQTYGGAGGRGSGKSQSNEEYKREEFHTDIEANKHKISLSATQEDMSKVQGILMQAGLEIDANGVLQYATDEANKLMVKVQTTAQQYAVTAVQNNMSGYLLIDAFSTKLGNELTGANGESIAATIVTKINDNQGTIYLNSDHVKLKDGSIITASTLDARLADIDKIVANTISASTVVSAATGNFQDLWIYGSSGGNEFAAKVDNAINSITPYTPSDPGKIGFKYTTLANPVGQPVDFNIADTEYYRDHVGIEATGLTVTEIGQTPYNNHSAEAITTPEIKAGTSDKYYLISATAKDGTTTVYKKFTLPAASAPPVTASIDDITGTSIAANHIKDTSIPLTASGTNVAAYTENLTLEETTYQVGSITRPCVVVKLDGSVIGRIYTGNSYNRGWDAAADVVVLPVGSASPGQSMALSVPYARTANGTTTRGTDQITYTLRVDQKYAYISTVGGNDSVINYAKYEHNQYTLGQNSVSASLPTGTPPPGTNASELSPGTYALTLTKGSTPSVLGYYTVPAAAVVTPKVSKGNWSGGSIKFTAGTSGEDEATVALKMSVDTGTNKSTVIKVLDGQTETGNSMTVYLKADNDNCYITSTDYTPNANNTLARITNPKTAPAVSASIDSIALRKAGGVEYVYVDEDREFAVYVRATGTNVSAKDETLYIDAGDAVDHGERLVTAVLAETASSAAAPSTLVSGKTYNLYRVVDGTRESKAVSSYTVPAAAAPVSASIDMIELRTVGGVQYRYNEAEKDYTIYVQASGTNVSPKTDGQLHIGGSAAFNHGRNSVKITNVERVASCAFDHDAQTAKQDVKVTLDNGQSYTIHEDFSDVYRAGRNGTSADTTIEYAVDLASEGVYFDTIDEGLTIDLSDIYQAGQNYTPPVKHWYTYSPTGGDVPIYVRGGGSGSSDGVIGSIYEHLNKFHVSTSIAFYACTPVEVVGSLLGYTQVSYNGSTYYVDPSNLTQSETDLSKDHRIGIKDLTRPVRLVSTTLTGLIHTGGATSGISVYLEPNFRSSGDFTSTYVSSTDFSSYRANGSVSDYFYEMATKAEYYGRHEKTAFSGDIQHKAVLTLHYTVGSGSDIEEYDETVVVSFNSYGKAADEVIYTYSGFVDSTGNTVPVYASQSTSSSVVFDVWVGATIRCQYNPNGYSGLWMPVQVNGYTGYMQARYKDGYGNTTNSTECVEVQSYPYS